MRNAIFPRQDCTKDPRDCTKRPAGRTGASIMTIHLEKLRFYGYHGLYVQEQKLGAWFELDLSMEWPDPERPIRHLQETINYVAVYDLVKARMTQSEELLETLAMELIHLLKDYFPQLSGAHIRISKINPPLLNFQGAVAVEYHKKF